MTTTSKTISTVCEGLNLQSPLTRFLANRRYQCAVSVSHETIQAASKAERRFLTHTPVDASNRSGEC
jgi:hypothetical protein